MANYIRVQILTQPEKVYFDYDVPENIIVKVRSLDKDFCTGKIKLQNHKKYIPFTFAWMDLFDMERLDDWTNDPITGAPTEIPYSLYIREAIEQALNK